MCTNEALNVWFLYFTKAPFNNANILLRCEINDVKLLNKLGGYDNQKIIDLFSIYKKLQR